jgi:hypothetical protein
MEIELIILIFLIILIILYLGYKYFIAKDDLKNTKKHEDTNEPKAIKNNFDNKKKIIQYFGGDYCPFSNFTSNAYKIMKDFENEYGDKITVNYYWAGKDNEIMQALDVKYVPTILNGNNEPIELKLPDDVDITDLSNDELRAILLENIYNNL